jgi:flagellar motor switch protein FliG
MGTAIQTANSRPPLLPLIDKGKPRISSLRKAAILMVLLGDEAAVVIYKNLNPEDVRRLTQEIAEVETISPEEALQVLEEYRLTLTQGYVSQGGLDYANHLLLRAFGDEGAKGLLDQMLQVPEAGAADLDSLQKADPEQLVKFVEGEHPQTIALILAHLGAKTASSVLLLLPEKVRTDAIKRLAQMQQFSTEMVKRISLVLHKKLAGLGKESRLSCSGVSAAAGMLNRMDQESSKLILDAIQNSDPDLAGAIRNQMFTFNDLGSVLDVSMREILAQLDKKTLATALKGANEDLRSFFYKSMSSRAVEMLKEDIEALGPVRSRQVQQAQQEVIALARKLEAEGKISLKSGGDDGYVD